MTLAIIGVLLMAVIGRTARRIGQRLKIIVTSPVTVTTDPIVQEPDPEPAGLAGQPIGLLLTLTYAS